MTGSPPAIARAAPSPGSMHCVMYCTVLYCTDTVLQPDSIASKLDCFIHQILLEGESSDPYFLYTISIFIPACRSYVLDLWQARRTSKLNFSIHGLLAFALMTPQPYSEHLCHTRYTRKPAIGGSYFVADYDMGL